MLRNIVALTANVAKSAQFYQEGLGLSIVSQTDNLAEISLGVTNLILKVGSLCLVSRFTFALTLVIFLNRSLIMFPLCQLVILQF